MESINEIFKYDENDFKTEKFLKILFDNIMLINKKKYNKYRKYMNLVNDKKRQSGGLSNSRWFKPPEKGGAEVQT